MNLSNNILHLSRGHLSFLISMCLNFVLHICFIRLERKIKRLPHFHNLSLLFKRDLPKKSMLVKYLWVILLAKMYANLYMCINKNKAYIYNIVVTKQLTFLQVCWLYIIALSYFYEILLILDRMFLLIIWLCPLTVNIKPLHWQLQSPVRHMAFTNLFTYMI